MAETMERYQTKALDYISNALSTSFKLIDNCAMCSFKDRAMVKVALKYVKELKDMNLKTASLPVKLDKENYYSNWDGKCILRMEHDDCWYKSFKIRFENKWTASVQFYTYFSETDPLHRKHRAQPLAEVAAWNRDNIWYHFAECDDDVLTYQTPDQVVDFLHMIKSLKEGDRV